jgi:predicted nuclease with TOPRIM domain
MLSSNSSASVLLEEIAPGKEIHTKASMKKKILGLKKSVKQASRETAQYAAAAAERQGQLQEVTKELEKATSDYSLLESSANSLQDEINASLYEKQRMQSQLDRKNRLVDKFQALENGRIEGVNVEEEQFIIEKRHMVAMTNSKKVKAIIDHVRGKFPHLDQVLERVSHLADVEME